MNKMNNATSENNDAPPPEPAVKDTDAAAEAGAVEGLAGLTAELEAYKDKYARLYAEFENARKRFERDKSEFVKYAAEGLVVELLGVFDDLERAARSIADEAAELAGIGKGIDMVRQRLEEILKRNGVRPVDSVNKPFDPHCHEILMQEPSDQFGEGVVMEEFQKGYYLGDRVIRTAKVKVATRPPEVDKKS